jgi:thiosulfate dehydrogenase [quinone] large subunit
MWPTRHKIKAGHSRHISPGRGRKARFGKSRPAVLIQRNADGRSRRQISPKPMFNRKGEAVSKNDSHSNTEQVLIFFFRLCMGWTFLWAGIHHFGDDKFVVGFLANIKTFRDVYAPFTNPAVAPALTVLVEYGHLLIGLSLVLGLLVRLSAPFAIMLMLVYWTAHMNFPFIENVNNYLIDYHIVYAGVLVLLIIKRAGHVLGLDGLFAEFSAVRQEPVLRWMVS